MFGDCISQVAAFRKSLSSFYIRHIFEKFDFPIFGDDADFAWFVSWVSVPLGSFESPTFVSAIGCYWCQMPVWCAFGAIYAQENALSCA